MKTQVTLVITNYMRANNIPVILDSIEKQTTKCFVWVINNGKRLDQGIIDRVDFYIETGNQNKCSERWRQAKAKGIDTKYLCVIDDDLCFGDDRIIKDAIGYCRFHQSAIGIEGVQLDPAQPYKNCKRIIHQAEFADIIKGRFILMPAAMLKQIEPTEPFEDDIEVSAMIGGGMIVPLYKRFKQLQSPHAVWKRVNHFADREAARRKWFSK